MGFFPVFERFGRRSTYGPGNDFWYYPPGQKTATGINVDETNALKYLTVFACVSLVAGDVGRLPLNLYRRRKDGGKDVVTDHRLYDLLHTAPSNEMTSFNWRESSQGHLMLWGNHYSYIERNTMGEINALWPIPNPGGVIVERRGNQIVYEYYVDGEKKLRTRNEIFHIPGYGYNGLIGMSMVALAREAIGMGLAAEEFQSRFFGEGTHPSIAVTIPPDVNLGDSETEYRKRLQETLSGLKNSHGIAIFPNGETAERLTMPLADAQYLESRNHQKVEICGMYHVPPHKIALHGANSNYNNLEQENASYVDSCLMHWLVRWESQINLQLLTEKDRRSGLFFEFLVAGLLRGDSQARAEYYNKIFQIGGITPNQIRAKENMNPIDGGDQAFVMLNMIPLDKAGQIEIQDDNNNNGQTQKENDKEELKSFFSKDRAKKIADMRSIQLRDRIAQRFKPLILDAAQSIVNRETKAIKNRIAGRQLRDKDSMSDFLNGFYKKFPAYIEKKMGPILRSYINAIVDATNSEIGIDDNNFDPEIKEYIKNYAERHSSGSLGQMLALLEGNLEDLDQRADEWQEKRPEKIATNETVRAGSAAFSWAVFGAGMSLVWRIRGAKTCPYCRSLDGRKISRGESFVNDGDEINPKDGTGPMTIRGMKAHPPLHQGCDCYSSVG